MASLPAVRTKIVAAPAEDAASSMAAPRVPRKRHTTPRGWCAHRLPIVRCEGFLEEGIDERAKRRTLCGNH